MGLIDILRRVARRLSGEDPLAELIANGLVVGRNFGMLEGVSIDPSHCWHITIGDDVTLAPRVTILAHDASTKRHLGHTRIGKVVIGNKVFVGAGSIILPGVEIGDNVVIGAGSIVSRDVPSDVVAAGSPARPTASLEEFLGRKRAEMERVPSFDASYTERGGIDAARKAEMNDAMKDRIGYVV